MAGKARVHELAKELGVTSKEVLARLSEQGEFVKSASSTVEAPVARRLRESFGGAKAPAAPAAEVDAEHPGAVNSPMVGVAYLSPEPTSAPFVTIGSKVTQGQTLMLIEAMKTYNQIKAPRAGTVTRILVESGTPVEFGEPLMIVE